MSVAQNRSALPGTPRWSLRAFLGTVCLWCWRLLWLNPLLWPFLIAVEVVWWMCAAASRTGKRYAQKYSSKDAGILTDGKLATAGSVELGVLFAGLVLQLGELIGTLLRFRETARVLRARSYEEHRAKDAAGSSEDELFHTPPSSPPPFDLMSPSEAGMDAKETGAQNRDFGDSGVQAPTLRERLRNAATAMNVMRRISVAGMWERRDSHLPQAHQADLRLGINRSMRAYNLFEEIKKDYQVVFDRYPPISEESPARDAALERVHERCAKKCLELARTNGGLYTKAAQFVASLQGGAGDKGIPKAYVDVLRVLTDAAPYHEFDEMNEVLINEFGQGAEELFETFDKVPIAAASLAQVHRAVLKNGMPVAVKILYPCLRKEMASDFAMFRRLGGQMKPGGYDMLWLVEDFESAIRSELDCVHEARNCEIAGRLLAGRRGVKFPKVVWDLTRTDVLVMEYMPGLIRTTEPEVLIANGLQLPQCGQLVSDALTELALVHGHVHGDPHAGNIYLTASRAGRLQRAVSPCVVVLDHGLYHHIDDVLRRDLCALFLACINRNRREIHRLSHKCAGPLGRFFPLLLSPWFILGTSLSAADVRAAKDNKLPPSVSTKDVGDAMTSLHVMGGNMLGVLHSFGYVRGLLAAVSFGERRRLRSIARMAIMGLAPPQVAHRALLHGDHTLPLVWRWRLWKAKTNIDVTAVLLHLITTATTAEFDVSKCPAPFVHLASACLGLGRRPAMHALQGKLINAYFYFYPASTSPTPPPVPPTEDMTGDDVDAAASREQTRSRQTGAAAGGTTEAATSERVGAVSLIQKVKAGVMQRARPYLRAAPPASGSGGEETKRHNGRATSAGTTASDTYCAAPSIVSDSVISRADSEHCYLQSPRPGLGAGAAAGGYSGSSSSLSGLSAEEASAGGGVMAGTSSNPTSPRDGGWGPEEESALAEAGRPMTEPGIVGAGGEVRGAERRCDDTARATTR